MQGLRENGIDVIECRDSSRGISKYFRLYKKHLNIRDSYDALIVGYPGHIVVPLARLISNKRVIFDACATMYEGVILSRGQYSRFSLRAMFLKFIDRCAVHCADIILVETEAQKKQFDRLFGVGDKCRVLYHGASNNVFNPNATPFIAKRAEFTVVFRGKFLPEAGVRHILTAAKILEDKGIQFLIIGNGFLEQEVNAQIEAEKPRNLTLLDAYLSDDELRREMLSAHISLGQFENHQRLARTLPFKLFESLALELPYITEDTPPAREILKDGENALFVRKADPQDLVDKILYLKNHPEIAKQIAKNGNLLYQQRFTPCALGKQLISYLRDPLRVLYLFNRIRVGLKEKIENGMDHDGHFFGMFRLEKYGVQGSYLEIEQFFPTWLTRFIRTYVLNVYYIHLPLFFKMRTYDVVFSSSAFGSLLFKVLLHLRRPRWVVFDYGVRGMIGAGTTLKQRALRFMLQRVDGIITLSSSERDALRALFSTRADRIAFLPLGVDTKFFTPYEGKEEPFAISPGRDPGRDFRTLALATEGIVPEVKVTSRHYDPASFGAAASHVKRYEFSPTELRNEYGRAKLFILPLTTEGGLNDTMGCSTLVEALAMGKAIIATRTKTTETYITHGENGLLVPEGDIKALREAVVLLWNNDTLRHQLGQAARVSAVRYYDAELYARNLADYFKKNFK